MRMLTTFLPPTSGRASLAGHDVLDEPLEVRRKVGYLPENVPLYPEMRVREYLRFRAKLKDVPRSGRRRAISEVIARCRLAEVEDRILGHLSQGYRQRVGLAEAMVHDPDILILDEPTAGPRPDPDPRGPRPDPRAGRPAHDPALDPHHVGGRGGLRPGDHHRPGPDRARRPARPPPTSTRPIVLEARGPAEPIRRRSCRRSTGVRTATITGAGPGGSPRSRSRPATASDLREAICQRLTAQRLAAPALDLQESDRWKSGSSRPR